MEENVNTKTNERVEKCNIISKEMESKGYLRKDLTTTVTKAQTICYLLPFPFALIYGLIYFVLLGNNFDRGDDFFLFFIIFSVICLIIHEGIHGLTWGSLAKNKFKNIEFGFDKGCPYCYCGECLKRSSYIAGAIMPFVVLGIVLAIVSFFIPSPVFFSVVVINMMGTSGDLEVIRLILKDRHNGKDALYHDHPELPGVIKFYK